MVWVFFFFFTKLILLFSKDALNWPKITLKTFTLLQYLYFKLMLLFLTFYSSKNPGKWIPQIVSVYNNNVSWAANQHIVIIKIVPFFINSMYCFWSYCDRFTNACNWKQLFDLDVDICTIKRNKYLNFYSADQLVHGMYWTSNALAKTEAHWSWFETNNLCILVM